MGMGRNSSRVASRRLATKESSYRCAPSKYLPLQLGLLLSVSSSNLLRVIALLTPAHHHYFGHKSKFCFLSNKGLLTITAHLFREGGHEEEEDDDDEWVEPSKRGDRRRRDRNSPRRC